MEGKAYTSTLRANLLPDAALRCLLLQSTPGDPQQGMSDAPYDEDRYDYLLTELIDEEDYDDKRELQGPCATDNSLFSTLHKQYNNILVDDTMVDGMKLSQSQHMLD